MKKLFQVMAALAKSCLLPAQLKLRASNPISKTGLNTCYTEFFSYSGNMILYNSIRVLSTGLSSMNPLITGRKYAEAIPAWVKRVCVPGEKVIRLK